ncbi:MAG TPA: PQQ-binding-like beta-propeller repeat protein [Ktedonobacteraceae bacterium]|nr:PQQ-binding-like beta-propeller repeat protein [Ktedonobacteraceae bacterium]
MQEQSAVRQAAKFSSRQKCLTLLIVTLAFIIGGAAIIIPGNFIAHASGASITVLPKSAAYSNQLSIRLTGAGFAANESVKVFWDYSGPGTGTLKVTVTASATGAFSTHFPMPLVPTGTYTVAAVGQTSGSVATGITQILPQMYLSPRASGVGTTIFFFGNAYAAGESVNIYWNYTGPGTGTLLTTALANSTGSFKVTAKVPSGTAAGTIPVVAIGQTSNASGTFGFILYPPLLALAPLSGAPGTLLTTSAYGFAAFEKVNVFWNNGTTASASGTANANGYLAPVMITVPASAMPANYTVKTVGVKSQTVITNTFSVVGPGTLFSTSSGPVSSRLTLSGFGYTPGETINTQWNYTGPGTGTTVATVAAGVDGAFTTTFLIPTAIAGGYAVAAVGATSHIVTHHTFTINSAVATDPSTASPGTSTNASGSGFQAGETVQFFLDNATGTPLASAPASSAGNVTAPIALPTSTTPGAHTIIGVGQTSGLSFNTPLTIDTSWGDFGFDTAHHRYNPNEFGVGTGNVASLVSKWTAASATGLRSSPVSGNGIVYMGSHDGILTAYNASTGAVKWVFNTNTQFEIASAPLLDAQAGLVFVGTMGFEDSGIPSPFYALNAKTGALLWSVILPWNNFGFPSLAFNTIYIGASHEGGNAMINALDEFTGHIIWQHATNGGDWGAVAADTSTHAVFTGVGNPANQILSLDASTGALNWSYPVPNSGGDDDVGSGITVANGLVYADSKNGTLYALNEGTGTLAWSTPVGTANIGNVSSPTIGPDSTLYVGSLDGNLYALNSTTGAVLWKTHVGGGIDSSPAIANGVVYFASFDKNIYGVNASTGAVLWKFTMGKMSYASPVIVNDWVYCAANNGTIYAFGL